MRCAMLTLLLLPLLTPAQQSPREPSYRSKRSSFRWSSAVHSDGSSRWAAYASSSGYWLNGAKGIVASAAARGAKRPGQACRITLCLPARLGRERGGVGDKIAVDRRGQFDRKLDGPVVGQRPQLQFRHRVAPIGSSTRPRVRTTRSGWPGRMVSVGCTLSCRRTTCCPVRLMVSCEPRRSARAKSSSLSAPSSVPIPSSVETAAALSRLPQCCEADDEARATAGARRPAPPYRRRQCDVKLYGGRDGKQGLHALLSGDSRPESAVQRRGRPQLMG